MIYKSANPIAQQSKEWIKESLFQLMKNNQYNKITITEITDRANLNRRTFYRNFETKDDVVFYYFDILCEEYIESLKKEENLSLPNITKVFFTFCLNHMDFLQLVEKNNLLYLFLEKLNENLPNIYNLLKGQKKEYSNEEELKYVLSYSVGGYWNTLKLWLKEGSQKKPIDLANIFEKAMKVNIEYISNKY